MGPAFTMAGKHQGRKCRGGHGGRHKAARGKARAAGNGHLARHDPGPSYTAGGEYGPRPRSRGRVPEMYQMRPRSQFDKELKGAHMSLRCAG